MRKPNLIIPLANSYNQRGLSSYTNAQAGVDQRKINCIYEEEVNAGTGAKTLYLVKRPGVTAFGSTFGATSQKAYLVATPPLASAGAFPWVVSKDGNNLNVSDANSVTTTLFTSASAYTPCFYDKTLISGVDNIILQFRLGGGAANAQRVFYGTAIATWTEITDGDFTALLHRGKMEHMDGYAFILASDNKIYNSDLNSIANWTPANFLAKQIKLDYPVTLAKLGNQILAFGEETMEVFYNAGNASGSPLSPIKQLFKNVGMLLTSTGQTHTYAVHKNILYFVGKVAGELASVGVFAYDGANVIKISTKAVDSMLGELIGNSSVSSVNVSGFAGTSEIAIGLSLPTSSTQNWISYSIDWKDWFERTSTVFSPVNTSGNHVGVGPTNKVYVFASTDKWQDDTTSYQYATQFKLPSRGPNRARMQEFGVIGDTKAANTLTVEVSDDDFQNWVTKATLDLSTVRKSTVRGGTYIDRAIRLSNTNALETRLQSFVALVK